MSCCECVIMRKDRDNPLALSSKKPCPGRTDYGRELQRLRADFEAERKRSQHDHGRLCVELRHLREEAEREQQRAVRELTARRGCQTDRRSAHRRPLAEELNAEDGEQRCEFGSLGKGAFCWCHGETYTKLEQLLLTLYEKINGEQAVYKLHHKQDLELEKAIFLSHLLEGYGRLLQGRKKAGHPSYAVKRLSRKPTLEDANSCQTKPPSTHARSQSAFHSPKRKTKQDRQKQPPGRSLHIDDPCTAAAVVDTCRSSSLTICHPHAAPHAGLDDQPPCCAESPGSDESPTSRCMDTNMETESSRAWGPGSVRPVCPAQRLSLSRQTLVCRPLPSCH